MKTLKEAIPFQTGLTKLWSQMDLSPVWMTAPTDPDDPAYSYKLALYNFCREDGDDNYTRLDALIYSNYGDRPIGQLPELYGYDTSAARQALAAHIFHQFAESWERLYKSMTADYSPLENYSMTETGTDTDKTKGLGISNQHNKQVKAAGTAGADGIPPETEEVSDTNYSVGTVDTVSVENTQKVSTYDANSKIVEQDTKTGPVAGGTNSSTTTPQGVQGTDASNWGYKNHQHSFSRAGNIGVMTATQMLEADTLWWSVNDFFDIIASNIASVVTNPYYE